MVDSKGIVISVIFFAYFGSASADVAPKEEFAGYVEISGHEYYLNTTITWKATCKKDFESRNMTLISFEGDDGGKWDSIVSFLTANNLTRPAFWISTQRLSGHKDWIWDYTGNVVQPQEFHWSRLSIEHK